MDRETVELVEKVIKSAADENGTELSKLVVFGSRVRDDYRESSDVDILIVSPDFENINYFKRPRPFYSRWDFDELPEPEFICLTPEEFEEKKQKKGGIVKTAEEEGVSIA